MAQRGSQRLGEEERGSEKLQTRAQKRGLGWRSQEEGLGTLQEGRPCRGLWGCCNVRGGPHPGPTLTDWGLSLLLSRDLFLASRFFFLCRGLDSRIISSSSKVGSQCRRPFCGGKGRRAHPRVPPAALEPLSGLACRLTLGTKPGSTFFLLRSSHSTLASQGVSFMSWRLETRCLGFTVRSWNKAHIRWCPARSPVGPGPALPAGSSLPRPGHPCRSRQKA